jgi:hypothetical protein
LVLRLVWGLLVRLALPIRLGRLKLEAMRYWLRLIEQGLGIFEILILLH